MPEDLPIFAHWMAFVPWLFEATQKFPRNVRYSLATRIENQALDIVEELVEARYSKQKAAILRRINLRLEKLRMLLRISHERAHLSTSSYRYAMGQLQETGRMLGGWIKQQSS